MLATKDDRSEAAEVVAKEGLMPMEEEEEEEVPLPVGDPCLPGVSSTLEEEEDAGLAAMGKLGVRRNEAAAPGCCCCCCWAWTRAARRAKVRVVRGERGGPRVVLVVVAMSPPRDADRLGVVARVAVGAAMVLAGPMPLVVEAEEEDKMADVPIRVVFFCRSVKNSSRYRVSVGSSHLASPVSRLKKYGRPPSLPASVSHTCQALGKGAMYPCRAIHSRSLSASTSMPKSFA